MKTWYVLKWACQALLAELHKLYDMILTGTFYLVAESEHLWIGVNPETVSLDANNVQSAPLQVRFWAGEGSDKVAMSAYLTFRVESIVGSSVTKLFEDKPASKVSSYDYTIPSDKYATANRISIYAYEDAARTKEIGSKQVNIVVENPVPFPRSEPWSTGLTYKNGEYLLLDDVIYMWSSRVPGNTTVSPKADLSSSTPSGKWKSYQNWPLLATNIALIKFGLIGSAVFKDEYMYSQQGTNAAGAATNDYRKFGTTDFTPNLMFDFLTGSFKGKEVEVQGDITANTMFLKVCTNAAGEEPNGAIQIGGNDPGPLPELEPGTCRVLKLLVPIMTRVPVTISLTTVSSNVLIAPDASILTAVRTYNIEGANGLYELNGFHELRSTITYWCLSKH